MLAGGWSWNTCGSAVALWLHTALILSGIQCLKYIQFHTSRLEQYSQIVTDLDAMNDILCTLDTVCLTGSSDSGQHVVNSNMDRYLRVTIITASLPCRAV